MSDQDRAALSKVPAVTLGFWIIKILATTLGETAGDILPATVNFAAANGDLNLLTSGELFPSHDGNLSLLARGNVRFDIAVAGDGTSRPAWGMIDAPLSSLISPLNLTPLGITTGASASGTGYLMNQMSTVASMQSGAHATEPWHAGDSDPVRVYALEGDIVNGSAASVNASYLMPNKVAHIEAGRDIVDLAYLGQQLRDADRFRACCLCRLVEPPMFGGRR